MDMASFASRRPAAGALPTFSLPPPTQTSDVPRMARLLSDRDPYRPPSPFGFASGGSLTSSSPGASDGLSPGLSSVNTGSSQGSQAHSSNLQYTYGHSQGSWPTPGNSSYSVSSSSQHQQSQQQQPLSQSPYGGRAALYGQPQGMSYGAQRSSQSPATGGDELPAPPYDGVHQTFSTPIPGGGGGGGGGQEGHHNLSPGQGGPQGNAMMAAHSSTQAPAQSGASAAVDPYSYSRAPSNASYYAPSSTSQQSSFPSYASHGTSPTSSVGSRGMGSISGPHHSMAPPPASYRAPYGYQHMPSSMNGPVMSNIHQPGGQMSVIPAMGMPAGYGAHPMMYGHHSQPQPQSERPFKCDQCTQSFSRNHDLKRHKRIHLAVKPFPCNYCSKSFSRKDALKVSTNKAADCGARGVHDSNRLGSGIDSSRAASPNQTKTPETTG
ncbi:C2H2 finger domain-containingprotein [Purpureocillium lavendulum]|uniref:C2H2 finger domain-containingprotein n=1 Tax=Purpureocillium lavendulum TaxID=1247861 RepID=A0AB34FXC9_9HYPO|nr:C2H2 finger domain-containingprotein [Purpureocillium lavendulum]